MLRLFWTPAPWVGVPADPRWNATSDVLAADAPGGAATQAFARGDAPVQPLHPVLARRLDEWLLRRGTATPVPVLAHGFLYDPRTAGGADDPFATIYAVPSATRPAALSLLPLVDECDEAGAHPRDGAIAFAWHSSGSVADTARAHWNSAYQFACLDLAPLAARAFASVLAHLAGRGAPVRILAHSLGTRLTGQAVGLLAAAGIRPGIERAVLLEGAEFCVDAAASFAGCGFDVVSIASRLDEVLRFGGTSACHPVRPNRSAQACVIGLDGLGGGNPRWLDLQLDAPNLVRWLSSPAVPNGQVYHVEARAQDGVHANGNAGHWACYTNRGNRPFIRDLLLDPALTVSALRAAGVPAGVASPFYGRFDGLLVPPTPATANGRQPGTGPFAGGG